ncbi:MAG: hypothetical protein CVU84_00750 [Firmicutes bacterium HGW-Firmicutes-1]|jgi:glycosyltransferase EpsH|nr:MAG: hypothetical protein CVU84_00750 [Firmicutes bacterium HGW-Firmicutes-1]
MAKVSIVVPVYNTSKYLEKCINSIINQTLQEIQIILVNDGSTDHSLSVCRKYAKQDHRIIVIDKPNGGSSSARNAGLEVATGEYIGFVDSDDWIELEMYENMYQQMSEIQADICMCNYKVDTNNKSIPIALGIEQNLLQGEEIIYNIIINMISTSDLNSKSENIMASVWRLIVKKELFDKYNLMFREDIHLMEDFVFCIEAFSKSDIVSVNRGFYYHYVNNLNSLSSLYKKDILKMHLQVFDATMKILINENIVGIVQNKLNIRYVNMFITSITNEVHKDNHKSVWEKTRVINELCRNDKLHEILNGINTSGYKIRKKLVLFAMKYGLGIYLMGYYSIVVRISRKQCR